MGILWVKIRSWHIVERAEMGLAVTRCGRRSGAIPREDREGPEATCETCLRWLAKEVESDG